MHLTRDQLELLARKRDCPRCSLDKTVGNAMCRRCRSKLPEHMRRDLEAIPRRDGSIVGRAIRAAANYFDVHFASVKRFGGGKK